MGWEQLANGRVRHPFEPVILVLAVLVVPVVFMEESDPGATARTIAAIGNWIIWLGFTAELVFVLTVAPRKRAAVRAHWLDVAIVVLTVPVLPAALATLRLVRLLRLARLAALGARAVTAERLLVSRQNFRFIALVTAFIVVVAGARSPTLTLRSKIRGVACGGRSPLSRPWVMATSSRQPSRDGSSPQF